MLYSDFAAPTVSTSADTASTTANITYNGYAKKLLGFWGTNGAQTDTAAQGIKCYALVTGYGMPGVVANFPIGSWRSADLIGASTGSRNSLPSFTPLDAIAGAAQVVTCDIRNAASSAAPKSLLGAVYSDGETLPSDWALKGDIWNLRAVPQTYITATPTSVTTTAEAGIGTLTFPADYNKCVGISTYGVTNGVRVTAEEFIGTCRYTATGAGGQFEPAQKWPWFGQQDAPAGTDIQDESFVAAQYWHPLAFQAAGASTIQSLVTLQTAITNASSFQVFAALRK